MIGFLAKLAARTAELAVEQAQSTPQRRIAPIKIIESTNEYRIDDNATFGRYWGTNSEKFSVPEGIQKLGSFSFDGHKELTEVEIPETVQEIGYHAFYECPNLTKIKVSPFNPYLCDIDGILYDKQKKTLLCCPANRKSIHIPATVTSIKYENAFASCHQLEEISVDKSNKKYIVIRGVLYKHNVISLTKLVRCPVDRVVLTLPKSITEICNHALENCAYLTEIDIPSKVIHIGGYAFKNCHNLESVKFPKRLESIGDSGFRDCKSLKEVILPYGTNTIIASAFNSCTNLETLVIPSSVKYVGYIVVDCPKLKNVTCHDVVFTPEILKHPNLSRTIYMIANQKFEESVDTKIKYDILWQLHQKHPNDMKVEHAVHSTFVRLIKELTTAKNMDLVEKYIHSFSHFVTAKNIDEMILCAIDAQAYEIQLFLTDYKYQNFDFQAPDWKL